MIVYCRAGLISPKPADTFPWNIHEGCGIFAYKQAYDLTTKSALFMRGVQSDKTYISRPNG